MVGRAELDQFIGIRRRSEAPPSYPLHFQRESGTVSHRWAGCSTVFGSRLSPSRVLKGRLQELEDIGLLPREGNRLIVDGGEDGCRVLLGELKYGCQSLHPHAKELLVPPKGSRDIKVIDELVQLQHNPRPRVGSAAGGNQSLLWTQEHADIEGNKSKGSST